MHGLSEDAYNKIKQVLDKHENVVFKLFGSRARGDYKYNSDIDIAIMNEISDKELFKIKDEFDDLYIIYMYDIVYVPKITNQKLIDNILKEGVDF